MGLAPGCPPPPPAAPSPAAASSQRPIRQSAEEAVAVALPAAQTRSGSGAGQGREGGPGAWAIRGLSLPTRGERRVERRSTSTLLRCSKFTMQVRNTLIMHTGPDDPMIPEYREWDVCERGCVPLPSDGSFIHLMIVRRHGVRGLAVLLTGSVAGRGGASMDAALDLCPLCPLPSLPLQPARGPGSASRR